MSAPAVSSRRFVFFTVFFLLTVIGLVLPTVRAEPVVPSSFVQASPQNMEAWQRAVHTAARRALEAAERLQTPDAEQISLIQSALMEAILKAPGIHVRCDESRICGCGLARALLNDAFAGQLQIILEVANEQSPVKVVAADVQRASGLRLEQALALAFDTFEKEHFQRLFEEARTQAVALERQAADRRASPPPFALLDAKLTELAGKEDVLAEPWTVPSVRALTAWLQPYAGRQEGPLTEEVAAYIEEVANRMADDIRQQLARQFDAAGKLLGGNALNAVRLASDMEGSVLAAIDMCLPENPSSVTHGDGLPTYGLFSGVRRFVKRRATVLEAERFCRFLQSTPLLEIREAALRDTLLSDLKQHAATEESRRIFMDTWMKSGRLAVVAEYGGGAETPAAGHFAMLLSGDTPLFAVFKKRLTDELGASLSTVRRVIADAQYNAIFSELDALDMLPPGLLAEVHENRGIAPETLPEALAFLRRGGIDLKAGGLSAPLLEETGDRARVRIGELTVAANLAVTGQLNLLCELERERSDSLKAEVAAGRLLNIVRGDWERIFQRRWQSLAAASASPYTDLTPPALEALNKNLKRHYDAALQYQLNEIDQAMGGLAGE